MGVAAKSSPAVLNSWKEIAFYLNRGVRTVQRWERDLNLPVHRIGKGSRSPVYALVPELRFWLTTSGASAPEERLKVACNGPVSEKGALSPAKLSHELVARSRDLIRTVAETSVRQQRQTELLQKRIIEFRSRMK